MNELPIVLSYNVVAFRKSLRCPIQINITLPCGRTILCRTSYTIVAKEWNRELERPENIFKSANKVLNRDLIELKLYLHSILKTCDGTVLSKTFVQEKINEFTNLENTLDGSLLFHVRAYIAHKEVSIARNTCKRYKVFAELLLRFEGYVLHRYRMDEFNEKFVQCFLLFGKREKYSPATLHRSLHFFKTVLRYFGQRGVKVAPLDIPIPKPYKQKRPIVLNEKELEKLQGHVFEEEELEIAKDWLLISCYTGQRISDFMNFDRSNLSHIKGMTCIEFVQKKTKRQVVLPLHPVVLDILKKRDGTFPPPLAFNYYNRLIKQVAMRTKLNDRVISSKRKKYRSTEGNFKKWEVLTSHVGRRSFATNFYGKIPTSLLITATGHSSEAMFQQYVNYYDTHKVELLGKYFFEEDK
ncbi:MAG: site-specific integrase [Moheibacter sp.]